MEGVCSPLLFGGMILAFPARSFEGVLFSGTIPTSWEEEGVAVVWGLSLRAGGRRAAGKAEPERGGKVRLSREERTARGGESGSGSCTTGEGDTRSIAFGFLASSSGTIDGLILFPVRLSPCGTSGNGVRRL